MRRKWTFSKLLLLLESAVVLYTTYEGFALARLAAEPKQNKIRKPRLSTGGVPLQMFT